MKKIEIESIKALKTILDDIFDVVSTAEDNDEISKDRAEVFFKYLSAANNWVDALLDDF